MSPAPDFVLAKAAERLPGPGALPGGSRYEPKWDGFRAAVDTRGQRVVIWSRSGADLTARFPDVAAAAAEQVPPGFLLDGELVAFDGDRLDFSALQRRMVTAHARAGEVARAQPASFVAFDLLAVAGQDTTEVPWMGRRQLLSELAGGWAPPMQLSPATTDPEEARGWAGAMRPAGVEGIVAKGAGQPYAGGQRLWVKVKDRRTVDVIAGAVIGPIERPRQVVAGLVLDGQLRIVGRTGQLTAHANRALGGLLEAAGPGHPWPAEVSSGALDQFSPRSPARLTLIAPIVVEVLADTAWSGRSFRHALRYVRARSDLEPGEVAPPE